MEEMVGAGMTTTGNSCGAPIRRLFAADGFVHLAVNDDESDARSQRKKRPTADAHEHHAVRVVRRATCVWTAAPKENPARTSGSGPSFPWRARRRGASLRSLPGLRRARLRFADAAEIGPQPKRSQLDEGFARAARPVVERAAYSGCG